MHIIRTDSETLYTVRFAGARPPLRIQIADNALPHLNNPKDCLAALVAWALQVNHRHIQQLKLASRTGSSLLSIEVYAQPDDSIDEMLFILVREQGEWNYCSPSQAESKTLGLMATGLQRLLSSHLQLSGSDMLKQWHPLHPALGGYRLYS